MTAVTDLATSRRICGEEKWEERDRLGRRDGLRKKYDQHEPKLSKETTSVSISLVGHWLSNLLFPSISFTIFFGIAMEDSFLKGLFPPPQMIVLLSDRSKL